MYYEQGFSEHPNMFVRRAVLSRLLKALEQLPAQYGLLIWDAYRPREVQEKLFIWMQAQVQKQFPDLPAEKIFEETRKYASPPSKVGDVYCPPHLSGGAIDLSLFDVLTQQEIDMGTPFDDCTERAHSDYFENQNSLDPAQINIRERRRYLRNAMESAGFTSYQYEWWHFDFGNAFWGTAKKETSVFGPLFGDLEWPTSMISIASRP